MVKKDKGPKVPKSRRSEKWVQVGEYFRRIRWLTVLLLLALLAIFIVLAVLTARGCGEESSTATTTDTQATTVADVTTTVTTEAATAAPAVTASLAGRTIFGYHDVRIAGDEETWYQDCLEQRIQLEWPWVISLEGYEAGNTGEWPYPFLGVLASNTTMSSEEVRARATEMLRTWGYEGEVPADLPILWANGFTNTHLYPDRNDWDTFDEYGQDIIALVLLVPRDINNPTGGYYLDRGILLTCGNPITIGKWPPSTTTTVHRTTTTIPQTTTTTEKSEDGEATPTSLGSGQV